MDLATIDPLENTDYGSSKFIGVIEVDQFNPDFPLIDEYLHVDTCGQTFYSKAFRHCNYLESKILLSKSEYNVVEERVRMEAICKNYLVLDIRDLITKLRMAGCKYVYRTPIYDNIKTTVEEEMGDVAITAKIKTFIFGKLDDDIFMKTFSL